MKEYILSSCASIISMYFILNNNYIKNLFNFNKTQPKQILNTQKHTTSTEIQLQTQPVTNTQKHTTSTQLQSQTLSVNNTQNITNKNENNINLSSSSDLGSLCLDSLSDTSLLSDFYIEDESIHKKSIPTITQEKTQTQEPSIKKNSNKKN